MKRARIVVSTIAIVTIMSAFLSFKATRYLYIQVTPGVGSCTFKLTGWTTTIGPPTVPVRASNPGPCTTFAAITTVIN
jgi:hypothetical protein